MDTRLADEIANRIDIRIRQHLRTMRNGATRFNDMPHGLVGDALALIPTYTPPSERDIDLIADTIDWIAAHRSVDSNSLAEEATLNLVNQLKSAFGVQSSEPEPATEPPDTRIPVRDTAGWFRLYPEEPARWHRAVSVDSELTWTRPDAWVCVSDNHRVLCFSGDFLVYPVEDDDQQCPSE